MSGLSTSREISMLCGAVVVRDHLLDVYLSTSQAKHITFDV
jgi:hypothetical protein